MFIYAICETKTYKVITLLESLTRIEDKNYTLVLKSRLVQYELYEMTNVGHQIVLSYQHYYSRISRALKPYMT